MRLPRFRYFGQGSISSWAGIGLHVGWYVVLFLFLAGMGYLALALFDLNFGDPLSAIIAKTARSETDPEWVAFRKLPALEKAFVFPYLTAVLVLLLMIMKKSRKLFLSFSNNVIFSRENAVTTASTSRLLIGFSVLTFNFTTFLVSLMLLMLCEIFKNGTTLKEENDLTI